MSFRRTVRCLWPWCLALVPAPATGTAADAPAGFDAAAVARVCAAAAPSVVRLSGGPSHSQCGVVVSRDGLVLTMSSLRPRQKVTVHLADGRTAAGEVLGGSQEMGFGLVRITDPGPWPAAPVQQRPSSAAGTVGVVLGYPRNGGGAFDARPTARLANVSAVSATGWAAADCPWDATEFGCGLFDLDGQLVGTAAASAGGQPVTFALAAGLDKHRAAIEAGRDLDGERIVARERLEAAKVVKGKRAAADLAREVPDDVRDRAIKASVKVQGESGAAFSGTLVDDGGVVVTCAHTGQLPGQRVTVALSDGRKVPGKVLGTNRIADVGLIRLDGPGPWPGVKAGDSALGKGQPCLIVGYPAFPEKGQPERVVVVVAAARGTLGYDPTMLFTALDYEIQGGMSGGGVFDREGRFVAVHCGGGNPRIEMVRAQWNDLLAEAELPRPNGVAVTPPASDEVVRRCGRAVVSIERDGRRVALGTAVGADGLVVTKSSLVGDEMECKLPGGRAVAGRVVRRWAGHDLALLKLSEADSLAAVAFPTSRTDAVGTVVWAPTGAGTTTGVIGHAPRKIVPEPAWRGEGLVESGRGPLFDGKTLQDRRRFPGLKAGDLIASVDGQPTATVDDVRRALDRFAESHRAGDRFRLGVVRSGAKTEVVMPLPVGRRGWFQAEWESARRSDLDEVATCDLSVRGSACGGPVFTPDGEFAGVCIASTVPRGAAETRAPMDKSRRASTERELSGAYVVPASAVKKALTEWGYRKE